LSDGAAQALKENYKQLRLDSSTGVNSMSRRITVRQLESLVRLSEALARLHCSETVEKAHVEEAVKLARDCNKPVVRPDIDLADDDFNEVCYRLRFLIFIYLFRTSMFQLKMRKMFCVMSPMFQTNP
jgi:DNA replication licensing factor MCM6